MITDSLKQIGLFLDGGKNSEPGTKGGTRHIENCEHELGFDASKPTANHPLSLIHCKKQAERDGATLRDHLVKFHQDLLDDEDWSAMTNCKRERFIDSSEACEIKGVVACDDSCGAREEPKTLEEFQETLEHYKNHGLMSGCSHAQ